LYQKNKIKPYFFISSPLKSWFSDSPFNQPSPNKLFLFQIFIYYYSLNNDKNFIILYSNFKLKIKNFLSKIFLNFEVFAGPKVKKICFWGLNRPAKKEKKSFSRLKKIRVRPERQKIWRLEKNFGQKKLFASIFLKALFERAKSRPFGLAFGALTKIRLGKFFLANPLGPIRED
jgi:hypothetical protein